MIVRALLWLASLPWRMVAYLFTNTAILRLGRWVCADTTHVSVTVKSPTKPSGPEEAPSSTLADRVVDACHKVDEALGRRFVPVPIPPPEGMGAPDYSPGIAQAMLQAMSSTGRTVLSYNADGTESVRAGSLPNNCEADVTVDMHNHPAIPGMVIRQGGVPVLDSSNFGTAIGHPEPFIRRSQF